MIKILEGQISFGGMQDALEAIARLKNIKHGLVRVTSHSCSGLFGVFCGRFITGAVITLTGESGLPALRKLLSAKDGSFDFLDVSDEPVSELNQSLGVDLQMVLASIDFSVDSIPISDQSLTEFCRRGDEVKLIDTSLEMEPAAEPLTTDRINQTYQRVLSLSAHLEAQAEVTGEMPALGESTESLPEATPPQVEAPAQSKSYAETEPKQWAAPLPTHYGEDVFHDEPPELRRRKQENPLPASIEIKPVESLSAPIQAVTAPRPRQQTQTETGNFSVVYDGAPQTEAKFKSNDEFKRLKDWKRKTQLMSMTLWTLVFIGVLAAIYKYGPQLAQVVGGVVVTKQK